MPHGEELVVRAFAVFAAEVASTPSMTLRAGNAADEYRTLPPYDAVADAISDEYLERHHWGMAHLDADSWRHYLPHLIEHALRRLDHDSAVTDAVLHSLRPPDREPPRLASLTPEQEAVVVRVLEELAFAEHSAHQGLACQVLEEWWIPGALYRPRGGASEG